VFSHLLEICEELRDRGVAVVLVEEKASRVLPVTDDLMVLRGGRVVWSGPPSDLSEDRLADLYLGSDVAPSGAVSGTLW
jgi:ABC-type branched-subunit amino acid transport system ATPase component